MTETDKTFIHTLAPQCPYVGGSAVYKARSLNFYLQPGAMFDDMKTCNEVGVYKQGSTNHGSTKSFITIENEQLANIKSSNLKKPNEVEILVYPNPANNFVDITYTNKMQANFRLYNSVGELILIQNLEQNKSKHKIEIKNVSNGMYHYVLEFEDKTKAVGKLIIQN